MVEIDDRIYFLKEILQSRTREWGEPLRCVRERGQYHYFVQRDGRQKPLKNKEQIARMAQELYDKRLCKAAERELRSLGGGRFQFYGTKVEDVYGHLHPGIQALAVPFWDLNDFYLQAWVKRPYQTLNFAEKGFVTQRGTRVRSKSEWLIDDTLLAYQLPAKYEQELIMPSGSIRYPDFTVLNPYTYQEIIWEHFGMLSKPGYAEKVAFRIQEYERNGFSAGQQIYFTFESEHNPLTRPYLEAFMKKVFPEAAARMELKSKSSI